MRRRGHSQEDAQDPTQSFFARLLERDLLAVASPDKLFKRRRATTLLAVEYAAEGKAELFRELRRFNSAQCGAPLPSDLAEAICPQCELRGALNLADEPIVAPHWIGVRRSGASARMRALRRNVSERA